MKPSGRELDPAPFVAWLRTCGETTRQIATAVGLTDRTVRALLNGRRKYVHESTVDAAMIHYNGSGRSRDLYPEGTMTPSRTTPISSPSATTPTPWDKVKLGVGQVEMTAGLVNELLFGMRDALLRTSLTTQQFLSHEADFDDMLQLIDDNNRLLVEVEHAIVKGRRKPDPMAPVQDPKPQEELAA